MVVFLGWTQIHCSFLILKFKDNRKIQTLKEDLNRLKFNLTPKGAYWELKKKQLLML